MKNFFALIAVFSLILVGCSQEKAEHAENVPGENEMNVYLASSDRSELVEYCIEVDKSDLGKQIASVIKTLKAGSAEDGLSPTVPENLLVESVNLEGDNVILHVIDGFDDMDQVDFILCRSSLIKSLTAIEGINSIEFYVDGYPMKDNKGKVYGAFYGDDVVTARVNGEITATENLILYFPDIKGEYLVRVDREVVLTSDESIEHRIIQELMKPPVNKGVSSVMPEESRLKSIEVSGGICYVDFNEAFKSKHYGGATGETMTVYAIVNSLTELPNISHVQFLIEGKRTDSFKGHLDFGALFENDINLISKDIQIKE